MRHHEVAERPRPAPERRAKRARRRRRRECPGCTEGGPRAGHHFRRGPGRVQAVCMRACAVHALCMNDQCDVHAVYEWSAKHTRSAPGMRPAAGIRPSAPAGATNGPLRTLGPRAEAVVHGLVLLPIIGRRGHRRELAVQRAEEAVGRLQPVKVEVRDGRRVRLRVGCRVWAMVRLRLRHRRRLRSGLGSGLGLGSPAAGEARVAPAPLGRTPR